MTLIRMDAREVLNALEAAIRSTGMGESPLVVLDFLYEYGDGAGNDRVYVNSVIAEREFKPNATAVRIVIKGTEPVRG